MNKNELINKIKTSKTFSKEEVLNWCNNLPKDTGMFKPSSLKVGDIFRHNVLGQHPYVLLKKKKNIWVCVLITTDDNCSEILEKCESRFLSNSYFTINLLGVKSPQGFLGVYENKKHLKSIYELLKLKL